MVERRVAFATLPAVVRVQMPPATRDQLIVTHSGEPRDLPTVRAGEWFARVAASRRRLPDQPDLVRLVGFMMSGADSCPDFCEPMRCAASGEARPELHRSPASVVWLSCLPDARQSLQAQSAAREGNTSFLRLLYGNGGAKFRNTAKWQPMKRIPMLPKRRKPLRPLEQFTIRH